MSEAGGQIGCSGVDVDFHSCGKTLSGVRTKIHTPDVNGIGEVGI